MLTKVDRWLRVDTASKLGTSKGLLLADGLWLNTDKCTWISCEYLGCNIYITAVLCDVG